MTYAIVLVRKILGVTYISLRSLLADEYCKVEWTKANPN